MCVRERERDRESEIERDIERERLRERERERERDRESEIVSECVSECVCARTRALASVRHTKAYGCMRKTEHACIQMYTLHHGCLAQKCYC